MEFFEGPNALCSQRTTAAPLNRTHSPATVIDRTVPAAHETPRGRFQHYRTRCNGQCTLQTVGAAVLPFNVAFVSLRVLLKQYSAMLQLVPHT